MECKSSKCCGWVDVRAHGAKGDGCCDDTDAIQGAIDALHPKGGTVCLPPGCYVVSAPITYTTSAHTGGVIILGAGRYRTLIDNRVANDAAFRFTSSVGGKFQCGGLMANLSIITTTKPQMSHGIYLRGVWQMKF